MFNEGNQTHNFISSSGSGTVINYGSDSDFLTSYGFGSTSQKVTVPTVTVPVPQRCLHVHRNRLAGAGGEPLRNGPGRRRRTGHRLKASGSKEGIIFIQRFSDEFEVGEAGIIPGRHQQRIIGAFKHVDAVDSIEGLGGMDQISVKTPNPKCRLFLKIDQ